MKKMQACLLVLGTVVSLSATAAPVTLAQFGGPGIGVTPWGAGGAGGPERNVVRGTNPANEIWVVGTISATVKSDGTISVDAANLLVASGNQIGRNGGGSPFQASRNRLPGVPKS